MRTKFLLFIFPLFAVLMFAEQAQSAELNQYVPPPLFSETKLPPPIEPRPKSDLKLPSISKEIELPDLSGRPVFTNRAKKIEADKPAKIKIEPPSFKKLPLAKVIVPSLKPVQKIEVPSVQNHTVSTKKEVFKKTPQGIVKGPKIMPSNKKKVVEVEEIFKAVDLPKPKIIKSMEILTAPKIPELKTVDDIVDEPSLISNLPALELQSDGSHKVVVIYEGVQSKLSTKHIALLKGRIIPQLKKDRDVRLLIQAYASVEADISSSDRRIALSRALEIRKYLLENNISSNRIDVRSLGSQTDVQPLDRVEFYLIK